MSRVSQTLDRIHATFDDDNLVANAGLLLPATLVERLGVEALINTTVRLDGRVGGAVTGAQGVDAVEHDARWRVAHRSRRHVARRRVRGGGVASGDGTVDARHVPAVVHVRSCPPTRSRQRHCPPTGVGGRDRAGCA